MPNNLTIGLGHCEYIFSNAARRTDDSSTPPVVIGYLESDNGYDYLSPSFAMFPVNSDTDAIANFAVTFENAQGAPSGFGFGTGKHYNFLISKDLYSANDLAKTSTGAWMSARALSSTRGNNWSERNVSNWSMTDLTRCFPEFYGVRREIDASAKSIESIILIPEGQSYLYIWCDDLVDANNTLSPPPNGIVKIKSIELVEMSSVHLGIINPFGENEWDLYTPYISKPAWDPSQYYNAPKQNELWDFRKTMKSTTQTVVKETVIPSSIGTKNADFVCSAQNGIIFRLKLTTLYDGKENTCKVTYTWEVVPNTAGQSGEYYCPDFTLTISDTNKANAPIEKKYAAKPSNGIDNVAELSTMWVKPLNGNTVHTAEGSFSATYKCQPSGNLSLDITLSANTKGAPYCIRYNATGYLEYGTSNFDSTRYTIIFTGTPGKYDADRWTETIVVQAKGPEERLSNDFTNGRIWERYECYVFMDGEWRRMY